MQLIRRKLFYQLDAPAYKKLIDTTIIKGHKKAPPKTTCKIIFEEKKIAKSIGLENHIESFAAKDSFVTLKDHKLNFNNNPTCRLINPAKSEIGIVSKQILQWINSNIAKSTKLNQWKNTDSVIKWFDNMPDSSTPSLISFDVVDFYPSISEELLKQALTFASQYDEITENEKHIIIQAKKTSDPLFKVTMGSYDSVETCELVVSYLLSKFETEYGNDIGLYRDDGLAAFNKTQREIENIKKHICKTFSDYSLKFTIEANKKFVNYLDITLDMKSASYKPYMKPGNVLQYVNQQSNHPP